MANYPTRGQQAPQFWDQVLKNYIDTTAREEAADAVTTPVSDLRAELEALRAEFEDHVAAEDPHPNLVVDGGVL